MLCGIESVQGAGADAETLGYKDECGQGACTGKDHHHNTNQATPKQGSLHTNHVNGKTSENRQTLRRRFLGDAMTKSGNNGEEFDADNDF